jgi:hypothetical protein
LIHATLFLAHYHPQQRTNGQAEQMDKLNKIAMNREEQTLIAKQRQTY